MPLVCERISGLTVDRATPDRGKKKQKIDEVLKG